MYISFRNQLKSQLRFERVTFTVTNLWHNISCLKRHDFAVFIILSDNAPVEQTKNNLRTLYSTELRI